MHIQNSTHWQMYQSLCDIHKVCHRDNGLDITQAEIRWQYTIHCCKRWIWPCLWEMLYKHKHHERLVHCQASNNYQGDLVQFILSGMHVVSMIVVTFHNHAPIYPVVVRGKQQPNCNNSPKNANNQEQKKYTAQVKYEDTSKDEQWWVHT